jgi:hypothetical protein
MVIVTEQGDSKVPVHTYTLGGTHTSHMYNPGHVSTRGLLNHSVVSINKNVLVTATITDV